MDNLFDRLYVVILEDDVELARAIRLMFLGAGWRVDILIDQHDLPNLQALPDLMLLDIELPEISGLDLLRDISGELGSVPKIIISGKATVERTVDAFRMGASDFFQKPFEPEILLSRASELGKAFRERRLKLASEIDRANRLNLLSLREVEVLEAIAIGLSSKEIGIKLEISPRTVEVHRAKIVAKLGVATTAEALSIFHRSMSDK